MGTTFNILNARHIRNLQSMVDKDRFSTGESNLDLHAQDQSHHPPSRPEAVMWPISKAEISEILRYANQNLIPVTAWGAGTSLEGNPIPVFSGLVLDFSLMNHILEIRETDFQADVEPGVVYQDLNKKLRHKGLFFPPDPGTMATIGGMIANNASGLRTVYYGSTRANILRLTLVLANGDIIETGRRSAKTASGYDLVNLFVGSEGTLGIVAEATVRLRGLAEETFMAIANFPDINAAAKAVFEIMRHGLNPASLELLAPECIDVINKEKDMGLRASPTLFLEFHGTAKSQMQELLEISRDISMGMGCHDFIPYMGREKRYELLNVRYGLAEMIRKNHPGRMHMAIDVAVPISAYPEIIRFASSESNKADIPIYIFGHAGDGNLHMAFMGRHGDKKEWSIIEAINEQIVSKAIKMGGTATGEHGVGIGKKKFMVAEHCNSLDWMKKIKDLFDPNGILNPGKIFPDELPHP